MEDDGETYYRVTVPRLPGLIAYGDDLEEGMAELEEAKKAWFSSCLRRNVKIPEPLTKKYSGKLLLRMPKSGQTVQVYFSTTTVGGDIVYFVENKTINGKDSMIFIPASEVTVSSKVPTYDEFQKQAQSDQKAIQDAYNNRALKYIVVSPKSKKGAKIYYAYKKSAKAKKVYFKATKKKIKYGKKYKSSMIVKNGKSRYAYIGKKRYLKTSTIKVVSAKYAPVQLSDDLKNLIVQN